MESFEKRVKRFTFDLKKETSHLEMLQNVLHAQVVTTVARSVEWKAGDLAWAQALKENGVPEEKIVTIWDAKESIRHDSNPK